MAYRRDIYNLDFFVLCAVVGSWLRDVFVTFSGHDLGTGSFCVLTVRFFQ